MTKPDAVRAQLIALRSEISVGREHLPRGARIVAVDQLVSETALVQDPDWLAQRQQEGVEYLKPEQSGSQTSHPEPGRGLKIADYMRLLAENAEARAGFRRDPDAHMASFGLNAEERRIVASGNPEQIRAAVAASDPQLAGSMTIPEAVTD